MYRFSKDEDTTLVQVTKFHSSKDLRLNDFCFMSLLCIHVIYSRLNKIGLIEMGEYGSFISHFDESLESKSRLYGDESHEGSGTLLDKGNSVQDMSELDEAIQAYNQCLKI